MVIAGFDSQRVPVADGISLHVAVAERAIRSCFCTAFRRRT
jgi:hypothetical protein